MLWQGQVDALARRVNTVAVDLPGHGRSAGEGLKSVDAYARWVAELVEALGAPAPIACGLSLGGAVAQQLLLDHAGLFRAGILMGTGARLKVMPQILETIENDYDAFLASMNAYAASPSTDKERLSVLQDAGRLCPAVVTLGDFRACDAFDVMARIGSIKAPVLVVTGEDDMLAPPKYGAFLEEHIPNAKRILIPRAGHLAPFEQSEEVNLAISAFLDAEGL